MHSLGDFDLIQDALEQLDAETGAAEAHGIASGMLCVSLDTHVGAWVNALFEGESERLPNTDELNPMVLDLFKHTAEFLHADQFEFDLLLPDEDDALEIQAQALGEWCQGFLYGLGCSGLSEQDKLGEESQSILKDLSEIAKLDPQANAQDESDAEALCELHEYVRVAVQIVMMEIQLEKSGQQLH